VWVASPWHTINVQRDGDSRPQQISLPPWYVNAVLVNASPDGRSVAFVGWKAPNYDSLGVGLLSLADGRFSQVWAAFAENGSVAWADDGSLLIEIFDTPESSTLYRARGPGRVERLGSIPRLTHLSSFSRDLRKVVVSTRDRHADAWVSKVVR
ncbi:MAG: hypothetical protein M3O61_05335, partial [Gemmatimonadota bacterium]|nr:hypothetical protein [Gemmatimonadota bacterium]